MVWLTLGSRTAKEQEQELSYRATLKPPAHYVAAAAMQLRRSRRVAAMLVARSPIGQATLTRQANLPFTERGQWAVMAQWPSRVKVSS